MCFNREFWSIQACKIVKTSNIIGTVSVPLTPWLMSFSVGFPLVVLHGGWIVDAYHIWVEVWILYHVYILCIMATKNTKITNPTVLPIVLLIIFLLSPFVCFRPTPPLRDPNAPTRLPDCFPPPQHYRPIICRGPLINVGPDRGGARAKQMLREDPFELQLPAER